MIYEWEGVSGDKKQERLKKIRWFLGELRPLVLELRKLLELPVKDEVNSSEFEKRSSK